MADENNDSADESKNQMLAICEYMLAKAYGMTLDKTRSLTIDEMKSLMFVVREAWYLKNDRFGELSIEEFEKLQQLGQDEDDEENENQYEVDDDEDEDDDEENDDPDPFGLRG